MKIYFTGSISGKKLYEKNCLKIVESLKKLGHEVIFEAMFKINIKQAQSISREQQVIVHEKLKQHRIECDLVVAELSFRSFGIGQEISHAFRIGKPVLGMHVTGKNPHLLLSDAGDRLLLQEYSLENIEEKLKEGIDFLDPQSVKRFTMLLPSRLVNHLDEIARDNNSSRSEYIRGLIENDIKTKKKRLNKK